MSHLPFSKRSKHLSLISSVIFIITLLLAASCSDKSSTGQDGPEPQGSFIGHSSCLRDISPDKGISDWDQVCIEYSYDGLSTLTITNLEAWYNCCLDSIACRIENSHRKVTIYEYEYMWHGGCDCRCPYNLEYLVENVPPGEFTIRLYPDYPDFVQMPAEFKLWLPPLTPLTDTICVELEFSFDK